MSSVCTGREGGLCVCFLFRFTVHHWRWGRTSREAGSRDVRPGTQGRTWATGGSGSGSSSVPDLSSGGRPGSEARGGVTRWPLDVMGEEGTVCKRALRSRGRDSIGDTAPWPLPDHPPLPSECPWDPRPPPRPPQDEAAAPGRAGTWSDRGPGLSSACPASRSEPRLLSILLCPAWRTSGHGHRPWGPAHEACSADRWTAPPRRAPHSPCRLLLSAAPVRGFSCPLLLAPTPPRLCGWLGPRSRRFFL